jgi:hypothetical protein
VGAGKPRAWKRGFRFFPNRQQKAKDAQDGRSLRLLHFADLFFKAPCERTRRTESERAQLARKSDGVVEPQLLELPCSVSESFQIARFAI